MKSKTMILILAAAFLTAAYPILSLAGTGPDAESGDRGIGALGPKAEETQIKGKRYAVIIGVGDYQDDKIPDLDFAGNDALLVYETLTNPRLCGYPPEQVKLLLDRDATYVNIKSAIGTWLAQVTEKNDTAIIFFAGHGGTESDLSGQAADNLNRYWLCVDSNPSNLYGTALNNREVVEMLARVRCETKITFLDSCYSGGSVTTRGEADVLKDLQGKGNIVIASSTGNQKSLELTELRHGLFTHFLVEALKGKGKRSEGSYVLLDDVWNHIKKNVEKTARSLNRVQTPTLLGAVSGSIVLADLSGGDWKRLEEERLKRLEREAAERIKHEEWRREQNRLEKRAFNAAKNLDKCNEWSEFLKNYPDSKNKNFARTRITALGCGRGAGGKSACPDGMALIKGGKCTLGSNLSDDEKPPHEVAVPEFCMDKFEAMIREVRGNLPDFEFPNDQEWYFEERNPAVGLTWYDAQDYCEARGKRLCSEAEWEYACESRREFKYVFGNLVKTGICRQQKPFASGPAIPGSNPKCRTRDGVYDMMGNIAEWTASPYKSYPGGDSSGIIYQRGFHVVRGGGWSVDLTRCAARMGLDPSSSNPGVGVRCCRDPD